jgi:hypothetical protein
VKRPGGPSLETPFIRCACLRQRVVGIEKRPGLNLAIDLPHPCQARLDELL